MPGIREPEQKGGSRTLPQKLIYCGALAAFGARARDRMPAERGTGLTSSTVFANTAGQASSGTQDTALVHWVLLAKRGAFHIH